MSGRQAPQGGQSLVVEADARHEQHQRRKHELEIPAVLHADRSGNQIMCARNEVRSHFQNEDRGRQHRRDGEVAGQLTALRFLLLGT
jgi:hypothetical protein